MRIEACDQRVVDLVRQYAERLDVPTGDLSITTSRAVFARWLGRPVPYRLGGAYSMHPRTGAHRILIHLDRLDLSREWAIEVVVAEELVHMRDHLRGDFRRHAHHGYDRIAVEVARLTGYSPEQQRDIFLPRRRQPYRYLYQCPKCAMIVPRRRRGTWSCGRCALRFNRRLVLRDLDLATAPPEARDYLDRLNRELLAGR